MKKLFRGILGILTLLACTSCSLFACSDANSSSTTPAPERDFKNVIVVIGDGMGENHLLNTILYYDLETPAFFANQEGYINTDSLSGTTDSAAGGTALATGKKVNNGSVAQHEGANLQQITEIARAANMKTGVVTTDTLDGATPAAFSAHAPDRGSTSKIVNTQVKSGMDLLLGRHSGAYAFYGKDFRAQQYVFVETKDALFASKTANKLVGLIRNVDSQYRVGCEEEFQLKDMAKFAVEYLENDNGFFLMIEGAYIDKYSHSSRIYDAMAETRSLIDVIAYLYEYAADGETAIFITADHETGGLQLAQTKDEIGTQLYTTGDHTSTPVPLFVKNYVFDATSFGYAEGVTPENTVVFEACKSIIQGN